MNFLSILVLSIFLENALFMRALGTRRMLVLIKKTHKLAYFGALIIPVTILHTSLIWLFNLFFKKFSCYYLFIPVIFMLCMSVVYLLIYGLCKVYFKNFLDKNLDLIMSVAFNTLIFGTLLLNFSHNYKFSF